jgi:hypothetical protein
MLTALKPCPVLGFIFRVISCSALGSTVATLGSTATQWAASKNSFCFHKHAITLIL